MGTRSLAAGVFLCTAAFRFLNLGNGFPNDHFLHLAGAHQMLFGDWPTRDFQDPGLPLMYVASAAAQAALGRTLLAEAALVSLAFAAAAVITMAVVFALTGSRALALLAALLEVAVVPRTYGYPKVLLYAAGFLLMHRYASRPGTGRLVALAACVATAFLFRHDHGLYLGMGSLLAVLLAPCEERRDRLRRVAGFAAATAAFLAPYVLYVELSGGLWRYVRSALEFSAREADRQGHVWPSPFGGDEPMEAVLVYIFHALPLAALLVALVPRRAREAPAVAASIAPMAVVATLVNVGFIRDPLNTRLADAILPAVVLGAWLVHRAWSGRAFRPLMAGASVLFVLLFGRAVLVVGNTVEELERSRLLPASWVSLPGHVDALIASLRADAVPEQIPSDAGDNLAAFFGYVRRCTTGQHRLLVTGFLPEAPYFAGRAFAGGQSTFVEGYYQSAESQRLVLRRLREQVVPFALVPQGSYPRELETSFPLVAAHLRARYVPLAMAGGDGDTGVAILVDGALPWTARDAGTGWPCFVPSPSASTPP